MSSYWAEANALANVLQKMANGVDKRIKVKVEHRRGVWGFHLTDPWKGDWWDDNFQKVADFIQSGF